MVLIIVACTARPLFVAAMSVPVHRRTQIGSDHCLVHVRLQVTIRSLCQRLSVHRFEKGRLGQTGLHIEEIIQRPRAAAADGAVGMLEDNLDHHLGRGGGCGWSLP